MSIIGQKRLCSDDCINAITVSFSAFILSDLVESCVTFEGLVVNGKFHTSFSAIISILYPSTAMTRMALCTEVSNEVDEDAFLPISQILMMTILIRQLR